jgi:hypothetical protein
MSFEFTGFDIDVVPVHNILLHVCYQSVIHELLSRYIQLDDVMYIALMFGIIKLPIVAIEIIALLQYSNL